MANKRICDRCGKELKRGVADNFATHLYLKEFTGLVYRDIDICDDCEAKLYKWLENKEEKECKCDKNVLELLDQLERAEKRICELSSENDQLAKDNEILKSGAIQNLLKNCKFTFEINVEEEDA